MKRGVFASILLSTLAVDSVAGEALAVFNLTGSQYNLAGVELGAGWGMQERHGLSSESTGIFASAEPGVRGCTLRSGLAYNGTAEMAIAVWRLEVVGVADHWSEFPTRWGPETTLGFDLLLARVGLVFGRPVPVAFVWGLGVGI